jgi:hypothetical protein
VVSSLLVVVIAIPRLLQRLGLMMSALP